MLAALVTTMPAISSVPEDAVYRKVTWRLIPFLMLCYVVAYLDRVNVGFAKLKMLSDLQFSETGYGLGAGMFFIGYFFFEVPSNLILHRVGARVWIARIMITWGIVSASFVLLPATGNVPVLSGIATWWSGAPDRGAGLLFYVLRFLLGVAEAGFYPGIILYLTQWYPSHRRARVTALFMTAIPAAGIIGSPVSGWIMERFADRGGWAGWQWLFLLEALPSIIVGVIVFFYLDDGIKAAKWLSAGDKEMLARNLDTDQAGTKDHGSVLAVFGDARIWRMCLIYFSCAMGQYGLTLWMPTLVQAAGVRGLLNIGMFTAIPYIATVIVMLILSRTSDRTRARRWHVAGCLIAGAIGLALTPLAGANTTIAMACLTLAAAGTITAAPLFWSLPTRFLAGVGAAAGIATINSVANLGGFISPYLVGWLKDLTHTSAAGMYMTATVVLLGAIVALTVPAKLVDR
jgi:MFS family permease